MMDQPDMGVEVRPQPTVDLEPKEELAPFATKASGYITPEPFNAYIVHASRMIIQ